jgi:predicted transglutaminase-like cysteine proteinase
VSKSFFLTQRERASRVGVLRFPKKETQDGDSDSLSNSSFFWKADSRCEPGLPKKVPPPLTGILLALVFSQAGASDDLKRLSEYASAEISMKQRAILVNTLVNQNMAYMTDEALNGVSEAWVPPAKAWEIRAGDCEEFVMVKYEVLRQSGVPQTLMRFIFLDGHIVLGLEEQGKILILDNRRQKVMEIQGEKYLEAFRALRSPDVIMASRLERNIAAK